jgi:hypothetical protein
MKEPMVLRFEALRLALQACNSGRIHPNQVSQFAEELHQFLTKKIATKRK